MPAFGAHAVKTAVHAIDPTLLVELRNIRVNATHMGCSGFITDERTGRVVYVSTDHNHGTQTAALYRRAADTRDYVGGQNHTAAYEDLAEGVVRLLRG